MAKLEAIGIVTADMKASVRFYRLLGIEVPDATDDHLDIDLGNGMRVMFDTVELIKQLDPHWTKPTGHAMALAFRCTSPADVNETYARVIGAGFRGAKEPYDAFWGQRYATLLDPDGNAVHLFADLKPA